MAGRKRKAVAVANKAETPEVETPISSRRRSQRSSSTKKKSRYFEADSESEVEAPPKKVKRQSVGGRKAKQAKQKVVSEDGDEDNYQDEPAEDDDVKESESEVDEDAPPKVTFIPIPKLRDTGGVDYVDDQLHQNTLDFLADLKANNKRAWLKFHDAEYRRSLKDWESYVNAMTEKVMELDDTIPELPFKDINFRIYRDIRFSNDPTPYKAHYGAAWSRTGRKGPYACYYLHAEPGGSFIGGGLWHPSGPALTKLRASIDERPRRWRRALTDPLFVSTFFPDLLANNPPASKSKPFKSKSKSKSNTSKTQELTEEEIRKEYESKVLAAFAARNAENALKTRPQGFAADHRDIALLRLRNFTVWKKLDDGVFLREGGQEEIAEVVRGLVGFVTHLNGVVMPDGDDDDDDD